MSAENSKVENVPQGAVVRVLKSDSFIEKLLLLVITALLTGILIPITIKAVDAAREGQEARARAQAKLFDDVSETILTYETLILDVSWYGTKHAKNVEMQKKAFDRYADRSVDLVSKWRAQMSRAQVLASPETSKKLNAFLAKFFIEQDTPLNNMWISCGTECDWTERHTKNEEMLGQANALVFELAADLGLSKR